MDVEVFRSKRYPLLRKLYVIVKEEHPARQAGEAYANLLLTAEGQKLLENSGYASLYDSITK
uniref:PBP domain-containing protein n=1 Tax=Tolypothrix bouteillei VB521301 TaxID=1479485 RepID=A0A0C1R5M5_9CYAN